MSTSFQASVPVSRVEEVVKRGWRRRFMVLAVEHSALALSIVLGGFILLILLGTQILAWQWLVLLAVIGLGTGAYGVRRELADNYEVAQMMDRRLELNDSLSTAWYLHTQPVTGEPAAERLLKHANQLAEVANPAEAFPFQRRRAWLVTGALLICAIALFAARYLVTREISLEHTFLPLAITQVFENVVHNPGLLADKKQDDANARVDKTLPPGALGPDGERKPQAEKTEPGKQPNQDQAKGGDANQKGDAAQSGDQQQAKNADGKTSGDEKRDGKGDGKSNGANASQSSADASDKGEKQDAKEAERNGAQKSSSMMDRMRDAMSSVMAKMKPQSSSQSSQNNSQKNADGQKSSDKPGSKDPSANSQKEAGKDQSAQEQSAGDQSQQGTAKSQASQGKDSATPSDKKGSDAQSGVGHSDGDKQVREAEQAKAMGKLAEIIGKRSANLTGDMQVVPSGKQRLQTEYTKAQGQHSDLGGEINRDDIPVEDQDYIREYMELVRKKPGKVAVAPK